MGPSILALRQVEIGEAFEDNRLVGEQQRNQPGRFQLKGRIEVDIFTDDAVVVPLLVKMEADD